MRMGSDLIAKLKVNGIAIAIAVVFSLMAVGFAGLALYYWLNVHFLPDVAALLTALIFVLLALMTLLIAKLVNRGDTVSTPSSSDWQTKLAAMEQGLQQHVDPRVSDWVKRHPGRSMTLCVLAGTLIGSNEEARRLIKNVVDDFLNSK
ncbi:Protein of unknown function (DUF1469) [Methylophaga frappieri]|uniref:Uncharacterized protein n=1 Tax=Methylophaga frappieri (strain ATCC BAA-2434 / DSM 25690 / JAM7) TaxID=754477 RepID=I1YJU1_METFJ|nr:phage holin family protein [Methylophaga frappieri]AFJ03184.1 Protein of unknown function (DUF1469) [Methylophaga frappieri]